MNLPSPCPSHYTIRLSFKAQICFGIKNESGKGPFFPGLLSGERRERCVGDARPAGAPAAGGALLLYSARQVYSRVVCGQCVWVEIRPVAALSERRARHIWGPWKSAVRKVISRVLLQRPAGRDRAEEWRTAQGRMGGTWGGGGLPDLPNTEKRSHGTHKTAGLHPSANDPPAQDCNWINYLF